MNGTVNKAFNTMDKPKPKLSYWCVVTRFYDTGKVETNCYETKTRVRPPNCMTAENFCDIYQDYFDTYDEAKQFEREAWNA